MTRNRVKLTQHIVDTAVSRETEYVLWDASVKGFGLRVHPKGSKRYILHRRAHGRQMKLTLGHAGDVSLKQARESAQRAVGVIADGKDPSAIAKMAKDPTTLSDLLDAFMERHVRPKRKSRTAKEYGWMINKIVKPRIGHLLINQVDGGDIERFMSALSHMKTTANRCREVLSSAFSRGLHWGVLDRSNGNPCRYVEPYKLKMRKVYLNADELGLLFSAIAEYRRENAFSHDAMDAVLLIALTGARRNEIRTLKWEDVDFQAKMLRLPDSKTGEKDIILTEAAVGLLKGLYEGKEKKQGYVFKGEAKGACLGETTLYKHWHRALATARKNGLAKEDLHIHDLRHTFASLGIAQGLDLKTIGDLLGHASITTTQRYVHLIDEHKRRAAESIGQLMSVAAE